MTQTIFTGNNGDNNLDASAEDAGLFNAVRDPG